MGTIRRERDGVGAVPGERDPLPAGFVGDHAVQVRGQPRVDLHEVGPLALGFPDRVPGLRLGGDLDEGRGVAEGRGPVDDPAGDDRSRPEQLAAVDPVPPPAQQRGTGHLAHRRDPVDQVQRWGDPLVGEAVDVGVPQPGDHELPVQRQDFRPGRHGHRVPGSDRDDAVPVDQDGRVAPGRVAGGVDDGDAGQREDADWRC
ncbi:MULTISPECIES: hypothetical protein [unclassified Saccharothrix]|uniref:hypothetical protein n=1 Tax=unclassified Saccharothrix TaxID=2593673 RepID=UPI00307D3FEA